MSLWNLKWSIILLQLQKVPDTAYEIKIINTCWHKIYKIGYNYYIFSNTLTTGKKIGFEK